MKTIKIESIDNKYKIKKGDILLIPKNKNYKETGIIISGTNGIKGYYDSNLELDGKVRFYVIPLYDKHYILIAPKDFKILNNKQNNYTKIIPSLKIDIIDENINTNDDIEKIVLKTDNKCLSVSRCFEPCEVSIGEYLRIKINNSSMKLQIEVC